MSAQSEKLEKETRDLVFESRHQIESYIQMHPDFLTALEPYPEDPYAPPLVREMIECTREVGVGPMASVAGAIAEYVGKHLLKKTNQVIVENGGDLFHKGQPACDGFHFRGNFASEREDRARDLAETHAGRSRLLFRNRGALLQHGKGGCGLCRFSIGHSRGRGGHSPVQQDSRTKGFKQD